VPWGKPLAVVGLSIALLAQTLQPLSSFADFKMDRELLIIGAGFTVIGILGTFWSSNPSDQLLVAE
jgi:hypothetical protein